MTPTLRAAFRNERVRSGLLMFVLACLPFLFYNYSFRFPFFCDSFFCYSQLSGATGFYSQDKNHGKHAEFGNIYNIIDPNDALEHPELLPWWTSQKMKMLYLRPVSSLSLKLDHLIWKDRPYGYRITTFFLHGISCILLFLIGRELSMGRAVSFLAGVIFTSHMGTVITLPYIIDRVSPLSVLFGLIGLYAHIHFRKSGRRSLFALSWVSFVLAFLSRESGSLCIFSYFLYDWFIWRKDRPVAWPGIVRIGTRYTLMCIPFFVFMYHFIAAGYGVTGFYSALGEQRTSIDTAVYILKNIFLYANSLLFYAYIVNENNTLLFRHAAYFVPFALMVFFAVVIFFPGCRKKVLWNRNYRFLAAWMFFSLLPNLYLIPQNRYLYPALAPFGLFMSAYLFEIRGARLFGGWSKAWFRCLVVFYALVPVVLMNVGRAEMAERYGAQVRIVEETRKLLGDYQAPVNVFFINLQDPLNTFALQYVFDYYAGQGQIRAFPLTVSKDAPQVEVLGKHGIRLTARNRPFLESQFERMFLTESPNREGYSRTNRYFKATVERVEDGAIRSIRFDFVSPLDDPSMRFLVYEDGTMNAHRMSR